jgi:hypothetical protein
MAVNRIAIAAALASGAFATPYEGSPFEGIQLRPDPYYVASLTSEGIPNLPEELVAAGEAVAEISTFQWL